VVERVPDAGDLDFQVVDDYGIKHKMSFDEIRNTKEILPPTREEVLQQIENKNYDEGFLNYLKSRKDYEDMFKEKFIANLPEHGNGDIANVMNIFPELWENNHVLTRLLQNPANRGWFLSKLNYKKLESLDKKGKLSKGIYDKILNAAKSSD